MANFLRGFLKWTGVLILAAVGFFFALRFSPLAALNIPEGLRIVLDLAIVGLATVFALEQMIGRGAAEPVQDPELGTNRGGMPA